MNKAALALILLPLTVLAQKINPNQQLKNTVPVTIGGTGTAPSGANQIFITTSTTDGIYVSMPSCYPNSVAWNGSAFVCTSGGGSMVYPGAGIPVSTGSAWGTSKAAPTGALVGDTDTQTLTNKTVDGITPTIFGYLSTISSNVQLQLNGKNPTITLTTVGSSGAATFDGVTLNIPNYVGGGGGGCGGSLTTGYLVQATGSSTCGNSFVDYGVTNAGAYSSTKDWYITKLHITDTSGAGFGFTGAEGTAAAGASGVDGIWFDSTYHAVMLNNNNTGAQISVGQTPGFPTVTDGATITWNTASQRLVNGVVTMNHATASSRVLSLTNLVIGASGVLILKQDGTGGVTTATVSGCTAKVSGGGAGTITLTSAANAADAFTFLYDGTNCWISALPNLN